MATITVNQKAIQIVKKYKTKKACLAYCDGVQDGLQNREIALALREKINQLIK